MYYVQSCSVRSCCACIIQLSHTHIDVIVGLLINSSMYICVSEAFILFFLMLSDIKSFPFLRNNIFVLISDLRYGPVAYWNKPTHALINTASVIWSCMNRRQCFTFLFQEGMVTKTVFYCIANLVKYSAIKSNDYAKILS